MFLLCMSMMLDCSTAAQKYENKFGCDPGHCSRGCKSSVACNHGKETWIRSKYWVMDTCRPVRRYIPIKPRHCWCCSLSNSNRPRELWHNSRQECDRYQGCDWIRRNYFQVQEAKRGKSLILRFGATSLEFWDAGVVAKIFKKKKVSWREKGSIYQRLSKLKSSPFLSEIEITEQDIFRVGKDGNQCVIITAYSRKCGENKKSAKAAEKRLTFDDQDSRDAFVDEINKRRFPQKGRRKLLDLQKRLDREASRIKRLA